MSRSTAITLLLLVHGLAHASAGVWATASGPLWLVTLLWTVATLGYIGTALGRRTRVLQGWWRVLLTAATLASLSLLQFTGGRVGFAGIVVDAIVLALALTTEPAPGRGVSRHPFLRRVGWTIASVGMLYVVVVLSARPVYLRWGTTPAERDMALFGDHLAPFARYRVDHGITVHASADSIWPWLVQMGQDRGGFYSHDRLERLVGDHVTNADRIHSEWQTLRVGDLVRAVQPDYLGGIFGDSVGWRVEAIDPGRAIVLAQWGAFVLVPVDARTTRLIVRTRGEGIASLGGFLLGPLSVFMFEPMHFIMQRQMLRGIKVRAEGPGQLASAP